MKKTFPESEKMLKKTSVFSKICVMFRNYHLNLFRAKRGRRPSGAGNWVGQKKKWTKKKGTTTTTTTTTNFVPGQTFYLFFLNFHTYVPSIHSKKYLWSLLRTNSLQKTSWRNLLWEKKFFWRKIRNFVFFEKIFLNFFFFFEKMFFDFNLKTTDWDRLAKYT